MIPRLLLCVLACCWGSAMRPAAAGPSLVEFYPNTPMPNRPGCVTTHCEIHQFGSMWRRRCYWHCPDIPRSYDQPPPRYYRYDPPTPRYASSHDQDPTGLIVLLIMIAIPLAIFGTLSQRAANARDDGIEDALEEAAAAKDELDRVAAEAEEMIRRHTKQAFKRGRHPPPEDIDGE
ncbi:MAG: hypothetical protein ACRENC_19880 [Gemmatimonadaceae bacterium]